MDDDIEEGVDHMEMEDLEGFRKLPPSVTFRSENHDQPHQSLSEDTESRIQNQDITEEYEDLGLLISVDPKDVEEISRLRRLVDTKLHRAVEQQDIMTIRHLMDAGASPAALDWAGMTPLHLCIVKKFIEPFTILLTYEGSADVKDASDLSVLHVAVLHKWHDGVCAALAAGANVTVESPAFVPEAVFDHRYHQVTLSQFGSKFYEDTLVHLAVKCGEIKILDKITAATKLNIGVDCFNKTGVTPLHTAIKSDNLEAIQILVRTGASVNRVSDRNDTALHIAVDKPHILKYLLDTTDVRNYLNDDDSAPLHLAVSINKLQSVRLLLDYKQHIELRPDSLEALIEKCSIKAKDFFRSHTIPERIASIDRYPYKSSEPQVISIDGNGYAPLHIAAKQRNMTMIALLLQKGAKLSTKGVKGRTALEIIATEFYNPSKCFELIFDDFISTEKVLCDTVYKRRSSILPLIIGD